MWQFAATSFADFLQLFLVAQLKSRRIVEDKTGIVLEYERPIDIVYPSLICRVNTLVDIYNK
jgi:hypothetical protein